MYLQVQLIEYYITEGVYQKKLVKKFENSFYYFEINILVVTQLCKVTGGFKFPND